jgi:NAD(P)-dependent dehydrogenase (short-subunit alcohol dehydrogenase family)
MSRTALITGASSGVGYETALQLARAQFRVVATVRNLEQSAPLLEEAKRQGLDIDITRLDVADPESIASAVRRTLETYGGIDVLVNNAGVGYVASLEQTPIEELRRTFDINFFGVWRVTAAVLPHMRRARRGHIITVTSVGGLLGQPFNDAYCAAKFAVEGLMESLAPVVKRFGIHISLVEPGAINTGFAAQASASIERLRQIATEDYLPLIESYLRATEQTYAKLGQTGADVAGIITAAATSSTPQLRYVTSPGVRAFVATKYVDPTGNSILELIGARLPTV